MSQCYLVKRKRGQESCFLVEKIFGNMDVFPVTLSITPCTLVDFSIVIYWTNPSVILGVLILFCRFYSIFDEK